jgi:LPS-assembly protein
VLEPVVQLGWVGNRRLAIPNEESTRVEFDEGNLLALSRFPAPDRRERKGTVALGVNWARSVPGAFDTHVVLGQVLREDADPAFTVTSGLDGPRSDFLLAAQIASAGGLAVTGRGLFDEDFDFAKAELRGDWTFRRGSLGGSFLWLGIDPAEDRFEEVSEVSLDATYDISRHWAAAADLRYDVADSRAANAALGLSYNNECVSVDLSVRRRYTTSTSLEPTTSLGLNIGLRGFSASTETERLVRSCAK